MADLFAKISCTYCQEEINGVRVQCCVCPDFNICLQCFSVGAEIGPHRNDHSYKFVDHCTVSIFGGRGAWTGKEQLQLLDAVELYGFGNWELVSQHVETRSPEEVKEEYIARYLDGNIGKATWAQLANHRPVLVDHVSKDDGPLSPTVTARLPPLDVTFDEARLLGYKPHRDDYERCFSVGAEIGPHRNDHSYKFVDHCTVSIFGGRGAWTGKEQLQLLDAVELYGFGNWELVSQHVETRSPEEVKEEYIARYLDGNIGKATWAQLANHRPVLVDHVSKDDGPLSPTVTARLPPLDVTFDEARLLGYKPHRDDYEREYNMEAEQLVASLQLDSEEDSEIEISLKLAMVDMYTRRLRERAKRKRIVRDYQLVAKYFASLRKDPNKRTLSKEQRDLRDKMRVFAQFLSSGEHERLIASIERERELRHRLSELLRYRSLGLTTQEEIIHYEQHAAYERQQQLKQNKSGSSGYAMQEFPTKNGRSGETDQSSTEKRSMLLLDEEPESSCFSSNSSNSDNIIQPVALSNLPLGNLLSQNEIQLCTNLNIQPVHYTTLKSLIIQENSLCPDKHRSSSSESDSQELNIKEAVTQYLSYSGWLPGVPVV